MNRDIMLAPDGSPNDIQRYVLMQTRAGMQLGSVEDIADAALLLVSENSRWITGRSISVSGGMIVVV